MSTTMRMRRPTLTLAAAAAGFALLQMTAITPAGAATGHHHKQAHHRVHTMQARAQARDISADFYDTLTPPVPDYCPYNTCHR